MVSIMMMMYHQSDHQYNHGYDDDVLPIWSSSKWEFSPPSFSGHNIGKHGKGQQDHRLQVVAVDGQDDHDFDDDGDDGDDDNNDDDVVSCDNETVMINLAGDDIDDDDNDDNDD